MNLWREILRGLEPRIGAYNFETWFRPTTLLEELSGTVRVRVPNREFAAWIDENFRGDILAIISDLNLPVCEVVFVPGHREEPRQKMLISHHDPSPPPPVPDLNPRYNFEHFVVGNSNQFACAAAEAVADSPAKTYNPLFIYGGVGLGKTHLLHAIGHRLRKSLPSKRLTYISAETFVNEMINSIRYENTDAFRTRYRSTDVLLVDDIQFLAGKERTQEEFFHTFNTLYESQKQIVLSSDQPPRDIPTLEERLRSRFEWGLIADIQPPDLETRVAIIRKKAEDDGIDLPEEVSLFIANKLHSNIRELEGVLTRVAAYASLVRRPITVELAETTLSRLLEKRPPVVTIPIIKEHVAQHFDLQARDLISRSQTQGVAFPRQVAMYLSKTLTQASFPEIGRAFGGKHHSTVMHAVKKVDKKMAEDPDFNNLIHTLIKSFK